MKGLKLSRFDELMEALTNPGEDGLPENIHEELRNAHTEDLDELRTAHSSDLDIRDAAIGERDTAISSHADELAARDTAHGEELAARDAAHAEELSGRDSEIQRLKAANYDLLKATPIVDESEESEESDKPEHFVSGIDSLFGRNN